MKKRRSKAAPEGTSGFGIRSGFKYVYLVVFFVLLSGFFHPLIGGASFEGVAVGTLVLLLGLAGGILLYRAVTSDNRREICLGGGFGLIAASLYFIFQLTGRV